jgi:cyclic pyranopterin phosphate synthase
MAEPHPPNLSHIGPDGAARMVDVGDKPVTKRHAAAEAYVRISPELEARIRENALAKGNLLEVARLAGIMAAKRTQELIPLCHSLPLDYVHVQATLAPEGGRVHIRAEAGTHSRTGVEMEALTAVTVAALTVIDMGKAVDRAMVIEGVRVIEKSGGRSGDYRAPATDARQ